MAWLAVNKDGSEVIGNSLIKAYYTNKNSLVLKGDYFNMDENKYTHYVDPYYNPDEGVEDVSIVLPTGTIEKLIGRKLTWQDEPVEI